MLSWTPFIFLTLLPWNLASTVVWQYPESFLYPMRHWLLESFANQTKQCPICETSYEPTISLAISCLDFDPPSKAEALELLKIDPEARLHYQKFQRYLVIYENPTARSLIDLLLSTCFSKQRLEDWIQILID
jgi:hypothetical protein